MGDDEVLRRLRREWVEANPEKAAEIAAARFEHSAIRLPSALVSNDEIPVKVLRTARSIYRSLVVAGGAGLTVMDLHNTLTGGLHIDPALEYLRSSSIVRVTVEGGDGWPHDRTRLWAIT